MWRTPNGERILKGAERELFRESIAYMSDVIEQELDVDDPWRFGVRVFDAVTPEGKLTLLADVGRALFLPEIPPPKHSAVNEGTIAAIYANLEQSVRLEIDSADELAAIDEDPTFWRSLILRAYGEVWPGSAVPGEPPLPIASTADAAEWDILIEVLGSAVLWDADYDLDDLIMDVDPALGKLRREKLTIDPDYFMATAPDPSEKELADARRTLDMLLARES